MAAAMVAMGACGIEPWAGLFFPGRSPGGGGGGDDHELLLIILAIVLGCILGFGIVSLVAFLL